VLIGIDIVDVERFRRSRYLRRGGFHAYVFTAAEQDACHGDPFRLARCFAGKEAVAKAVGSILDPAASPLDFCRHVQVIQRPDGTCDVAMTGRWAGVPEARGVGGIAVRVGGDRLAMAAAAVATAADETAEIDEVANAALKGALRAESAVRLRRDGNAR
jgi:phosphopantetheine--protein transferase-like protein